MELIGQGIKQALWLLLAADPEVLGITLLSLQVSSIATAVSLLIGIPLGTLIAFTPFPGRRLVMSLINTGMGLPPVVVGLFVSVFLWCRSTVRLRSRTIHDDIGCCGALNRWLSSSFFWPSAGNLGTEPP